jgi:hypothetical protein
MASIVKKGGESTFAALVMKGRNAQRADPAKLQTMPALHDSPGPQQTFTNTLHRRGAARQTGL